MVKQAYAYGTLVCAESKHKELKRQHKLKKLNGGCHYPKQIK